MRIVDRSSHGVVGNLCSLMSLSHVLTVVLADFRDELQLSKVSLDCRHSRAVLWNRVRRET